MGVVVRRYIDILTMILIFPIPLVLGIFLAAASLLLCSFLKCFFGLVSVIFLQYIANVTHRTFEIVQNSEYNFQFYRRVIINLQQYRVRRNPRAQRCSVF